MYIHVDFYAALPTWEDVICFGGFKEEIITWCYWFQSQSTGSKRIDQITTGYIQSTPHRYVPSNWIKILPSSPNWKLPKNHPIWTSLFRSFCSRNWVSPLFAWCPKPMPGLVVSASHLEDVGKWTNCVVSNETLYMDVHGLCVATRCLSCIVNCHHLEYKEWISDL